MSQDPLVGLKERLAQLEKTLQKLANSMDEDLNIARELQKILMPNRTPEVPGLKTLARYISAQQIASESFDLIPTKDMRELWVVAAWTESFGLSSVLLQALVHLQSKALVEARPKITPSEVFNEVSVSLTGAKKNGAYRLMISKLNLASLELSGVSTGMLPWIRRQPKMTGERNAWEFVQPESTLKRPELLGPSQSAAPRLADEAYNFSFHVNPGSRLYYLSSEWFESTALEDFADALELQTAASADGSLLSDMNYLLLKAQDHLKERGRQTDLTAIALEIDARKMHLA